MTTGVPRTKNITDSASTLFDLSEVLSRVDGDAELLANLIDIFFIEAGPMMQAVRDSITSSDAGKLEKTAHRLKGSVTIFGAQMLSQVAFELEKMGRAGDLTQAAQTLEQLEQQMAGLHSTLKQFRRDLPPSS